MFDAARHVTMTGLDLLEHVESLEVQCRKVALGWESPGPGTGFPSRELSKREAAKWYALAAIFSEARDGIFELVRHEIHEESCGA